MIAELGLALVLLVGAGLMIKSFLRLMAVPKGFNPDGVLTLTLAPSLAKYPPGSTQRVAYYQEVLNRVQSSPGIQSAGLTSYLPFGGRGLIGRLQIEGRPPFEPGKEPIVALNFISPEYFQTMGIEIGAGRPFDTQDGAEAPQVVIINETLAQRFFPNENPIGHRLFSEPPLMIVGVAGDTRHHGLDQEVQPEVYLPYVQYLNGLGNLRLVVRAASGQNNPTSLSSLPAAIRNQVRAIGPNEPVNQIVTMDELLSNSIGGGVSRRSCSASSRRWRSPSRRSEFTASSLMLSASGRMRLAFGWPWARKRATCCSWLSGEG
jgi:putative ABC transport system permease protein